MGNAQGTPEEPIDVDVLIIGAGATGLGAAYRLNQLGLDSWALVDANGNPGGSSGSVKTTEGFRFDLGVQQQSNPTSWRGDVGDFFRPF